MSSIGFNGCNQSLVNHLCRFLGQTVTIFTTSGGPSGCGFTGVLLAVNCNFVRLSTHQGTPPFNPLSESICGDLNDGGGLAGGIGGGLCGIGGGLGGKIAGGIGGGKGCGNDHGHIANVGSVCDIPISRIAAFCHNSV